MSDVGRGIAAVLRVVPQFALGEGLMNMCLTQVIHTHTYIVAARWRGRGTATHSDRAVVAQSPAVLRVVVGSSGLVLCA